MTALLRPFGWVAPAPGSPYRPDIDGLRALAVLAVVMFHYAPTRLPGGFIGVDIFFVISGYLITGILMQDYASHGYSLWRFYRRRIRRIFPALALILAFCLLAGWLLLFPSEYRALGRYVAAGAGFVENFALWQEAGYFDTSAILKPLLHLWSLAVEEQFYILWPLVLWWLLRRRWPLLGAITGIAAVSFLWSSWSVGQGGGAAAYYSPLSRAWELMLGAWLAVAERQRPAWLAIRPAAQSLAGLGLIALGLVLVREDSFPGVWALPPVLGTALVISAGAQSWPNRLLLGWRPAVAIGLISYPLYLWHWVLWSLANQVFGPGAKVAGLRPDQLRDLSLLLALALSWATYRWLEQPLRRARGPAPVLALAAVVAVLGAGGLGIWLRDGLPGRALALYNLKGESYLATGLASPFRNTCLNRGRGLELYTRWYCDLGDETAPGFIMVYGDSHSAALLSLWDRYGREAGIRIRYTGRSGDLLLADIYNDTRDDAPSALKLATKVIDHVSQERPAGVVIAHRWTLYDNAARIHLASAPAVRGAAALEAGLRATLARYHAAGVPVLLLEDAPNQTAPLPKARLRFAFAGEAAVNADALTLARHRAMQEPVNRLLRRAAADYPEVEVLNLDAAVCDARLCPWVADGALLYYDNDHLSEAGAARVYPLLAQSMDRAFGLQRLAAAPTGAAGGGNGRQDAAR